MKETNVNTILQAIDQVASVIEYTFYTDAFYPIFRAYVLAAYFAADSVTQISTRDVGSDCTYILARETADVIYRGRHDRCKVEGGIVRYEDLRTDIGNIFGALQVAFLGAQ